VGYLKRLVGRKLIRRVAPIVCVGMIAVGAAACGSSGGTGAGGSQNSPTPTTAPAKSGGAGF